MESVSRAALIMEAEVPEVFLGCFLIVILCKAMLGSALFWGHNRKLFPAWVGHLCFELLSFYCICSVIFRGRIPYTFETDPGFPSINNSICIGLFGVCWTISVFFLIYLLFKAIRKQNS